jgi:hypothetical protein
MTDVIYVFIFITICVEVDAALQTHTSFRNCVRTVCINSDMLGLNISPWLFSTRPCLLLWCQWPSKLVFIIMHIVFSVKYKLNFHVQFRQRSVFKAMSWLRWLVNGLSPQTPQFDPGPVHVRFEVDTQRDSVFSECISFPTSVSFHHCSILIFILILLISERQTGELWEPL